MADKQNTTYESLLAFMTAVLIPLSILAFFAAHNGLVLSTSTGISMLPTYGTLGINLEVKTKNLSYGDVATYRKGNTFIKHRVLDVEDVDEDNTTEYLFKGDNNERVDGWIGKNRVRSKVLVHIPVNTAWYFTTHTTKD